MKTSLYLPKHLATQNNIVQWSRFIKIISWILIFSMLHLTIGCMNYFKVNKASGPARENLENFNTQNKKLVVHLDAKAWVLTDPEISNDQLTGNFLRYIPILNKPVKQDRPNRYKKSIAIDESSILNEVHIYTSKMDTCNGKALIPFDDVQKIELYEKDKGTTAVSYVLGFVGVTMAFILLVGVMALATKQSCPFIYSFDGEEYHFIGEIYSGSVQPNLERHDYLELPVFNPENKYYQAKITNEVKEVQHTNMIEMWVFDHGKDEDVWVDKYGNYHTVSEAKPPSSAKNFAGLDIKQLVMKQDSLFYTSVASASEMPLTDGIFLEFDNPQTSNEAKLIIRAKNSFVLDYMVGEFHDLFGHAFGRWQKRQSKVPGNQLTEWMLNQNLPLSVHIERNGTWEAVDYFNIAGPMAMRQDILSIPLTDEEPNPLRIKLEYGNFFWEIDYVGIDFSSNIKLNHHIVPIETAITEKGKDVAKTLLKDDKLYYNQPEIGNYALLTFSLPAPTSENRSIFLHSKGWYQPLRNPSGKPDREYLANFRQPGYFNQFVNERMQTIFASKNNTLQKR